VTIYELIAELSAQGLDPEVIADKVCERRDIAKLAKPLVLNAARSIERSDVRAVESEIRASNALKTDRRALATGLTWPQRLKILLDQEFALPGGAGRVKWGDATVDQHLNRATYLRRLSDSIRATAELHESAAREIKTNKVSCLRDLAKRAPQ